MAKTQSAGAPAPSTPPKRTGTRKELTGRQKAAIFLVKPN